MITGIILTFTFYFDIKYYLILSKKWVVFFFFKAHRR